MKRLITLLIFSLILLPVFAANNEITISRVRVFLDDVEITKDDDAAISYSTILSFSTIRAGKKYTVESLDSECKQTQLRLLNSGYFYNAVVDVVPPRKNPDKRTVIISVTKGFLPRFGGGPYYGMFGRVGVGGKRNQLIGVAGWNLLGATYTDENFCDLPVIVGASMFTDAPAGIFGGNGVSFNGTFTLGAFIEPDLRFCVDVLALTNTKYGFIDEQIILSPYLYNKHYINNKASWESEVRMYCKPTVSSGDFGAELCNSINYSPIQKLNLAALVCGGTGFGKAADQIFVHDLSLEHNSVSSMSGLSKRSVRSGYATEELCFDSYVLTSLEARWKAVDFIIAGTFPCAIRPFVYTDLALGKTSVQSDSKNWNFVDAYGAGLQINFDCPVFAYFNFAYGFNHEGKGKFCFYTGLSF